MTVVADSGPKEGSASESQAGSWNTEAISVSENSTTPRAPKVSVIVPAYNAEATIERCLDALILQTARPGSYELIVVDDGSTDLTREKVKAYAGVRLHVQAHAGPAAARNLGAHHAQGEVLLFTDADCEPTEAWIEEMLAPLADREIAGVKGAYLSRQRKPVARFVQLEYEDKYDRMARDKYIDFVDTYAAGYRSDIFLADGGFDTFFSDASVEDQELSFRLARQGHKMVFAPDARVCHWGHAESLWGYFRRKLRIGFWKVAVHRRHPGKLVRDSHTPQSMKTQIFLVGLGALLLFGGFFQPALRWGLVVTALLFILTSIPFVSKAWRKDRPVAMLAPLLLFARALALGVGLIAGVLLNPGAGDRSRDRNSA